MSSLGGKEKRKHKTNGLVIASETIKCLHTEDKGNDFFDSLFAQP